MPKQRIIILPPHLKAVAALAFESWDEAEIETMLRTQPGIVGVQVTIHDDGETATLSATDGDCGALWTTPLPPIADEGQQPQFPELAKLVPTVPPLLRVRFDAARLGRIVAAAAELCRGTVELSFYPAGSSPLRPDAAAPVILTGASLHGGVFIGFLTPIPPESTT